MYRLLMAGRQTDRQTDRYRTVLYGTQAGWINRPQQWGCLSACGVFFIFVERERRQGRKGRQRVLWSGRAEWAREEGRVR